MFTWKVHMRRLSQVFYGFVEVERMSVYLCLHNKAVFDKHWGQRGYREGKQWRRCVNFIKTNIYAKLISYK